MARELKWLTLQTFWQAWKKIEETKKKAEEVVAVRQRNAEQNQNKEMMKAQKDMEVANTHERNLQEQ